MAQIGQIYYRIPSSSGYLTTSIGSSVIDPYTDVLAQVGASQFTKVGVQAPPGTQMVLNQIKQIMVGRTGIYELDEDIMITELYFMRPQNYVRDEDAENAAMAEGQQGIEDAMTTKQNAYLDWTQGYAESWIDILNQISEYTVLLEQAAALLTTKRTELAQLQSELATLTPGTDAYQAKNLEIAAKETEITEIETDIEDYTNRLTVLRACYADKAKMQSIEDAYLAAYTKARAKYYEGVNGIYVVGEVGDLENVIIDYIWE